MGITEAVREKIKKIRDGSGVSVRDVLQYGDMDVDVRDENGALLFSAIVKVSDGGAVTFRESTDKTPHKDLDYIPATIRGYSTEKQKSVHMRGTMVRLDDGLWTSPDLSITRVISDRKFYRIRLNAEGGVMGGGEDAYNPCRVRDISVGGVRLTSWAKYAPGDNLTLTVDLFGDNHKQEMKCRVIRVSGEGPYSYNCSFTSLDETTKRRLTRDIFNAQVGHG